MTNFLSFSDHLDINEMLNVSFTEKEINDIDKITKEIFLSENYEETYALYESENLQKLKDAFKRNPDESTFKKILKYLAVAVPTVGTAAMANIMHSAVKVDKLMKATGVKDPNNFPPDVQKKIATSVSKSALKTGLIVALFARLAIGIYRKYTDTCEAKKNTPINWWRCQKDGAVKTKASLKSNYEEARRILQKGKDNEKDIEKLKATFTSKMEYLDEKIGKCEAKIKYLS